MREGKQRKVCSPVRLPLCQRGAFPGFSFPVSLSPLLGKTPRFAPALGRDDGSAGGV